ncbi:MAG: hypothetical protein CMP61_08980 [Flavobacteriales bacterium]|nr:hypothetical protein [Flavobacteriales bacterium]|tara:strand:- start:9969 stop:10679 length:711 start_codon:yes stop_codon:yes gene_type:complete
MKRLLLILTLTFSVFFSSVAQKKEGFSRFQFKSELLSPVLMQIVPKSYYFDYQIQARLFGPIYGVFQNGFGWHKFENIGMKLAYSELYESQLLTGTSTKDFYGGFRVYPLFWLKNEGLKFTFLEMGYRTRLRDENSHFWQFNENLVVENEWTVYYKANEVGWFFSGGLSVFNDIIVGPRSKVFFTPEILIGLGRVSNKKLTIDLNTINGTSRDFENKDNKWHPIIRGKLGIGFFRW